MRKVLITGGTGKIGSELVKQMIADGYEVIFTSRSIEKGKALVNQFSLKNCIPVVLDFNKSDNVKDWASKLPIKVDAVIHNARSLEFLKPNEEGRVTAEQIQQELYMAVSFPYLLTYALIDTNHPLKDVVFISSMYGVVAPNPSLYDDFQRQSPVHYGTAKAAQIHLTKELAVRLRDQNVRVNCISYGGVEGRVSDDFKKRYNSLNPMGRMLDEKDLYPPVQYILKNKSLAITGENIKIDGGWTIW